MANVPLPSPDEPFVLASGKINPVWHRFLADIIRRLRALEAA